MKGSDENRRFEGKVEVSGITGMIWREPLPRRLTVATVSLRMQTKARGA